MSVSSTRKVSSSTSSATRSTTTYNRSSTGGNFVEVIDTANNVLIKDSDSDEFSKNHEQPTPKEEKEEKNNLSSNSTYIPNALEALAASGVYDDQDPQEESETENKVGVYGNNQSIIHGDQQEKLNLNYLKRFYERNGVIDDIDELV